MYYIDKYKSKDLINLTSLFLQFSKIRIKDWNLPEIEDRKIIKEFISFLNSFKPVIFVIRKKDTDKIFWFIIARNSWQIAPYMYEYDSLYIAFVFVTPELQWKGLSTKLFNEIEKYAKNNNYKNLVLHVANDNSAKEIYQHLGFEPYYIKMKKKLV